MPAATPGRNRRRAAASPTTRTAGVKLAHRRDERAGRVGPAELLDDHRQLDRAEAQPAAVLGDGEGGPAELDHLLPQGVRDGTVLDDRPDEAHRALARQDGPDPVAQILLLGGELQLHVGENGT